jgi:hypothetical protein
MSSNVYLLSNVCRTLRVVTETLWPPVNVHHAATVSISRQRDMMDTFTCIISLMIHFLTQVVPSIAVGDDVREAFNDCCVLVMVKLRLL